MFEVNFKSSFFCKNSNILMDAILQYLNEAK